MDRRLALALVLTAVVVFGVPLLFPDAGRAPVPVEQVAGDSLTATADRPADAARGAIGAGADATTGPEAPDTGAAIPAAMAPAPVGETDSVTPRMATAPAPVETTTVATPLSVYSFTSQGAAPLGTTLVRYVSLRSGADSQKVELTRPGAPLLGYRLVVPGDTIDLDRVSFRTERGAQEGSAPAPLVYRGDVDGMAITIAYTFRPDSYQVAVRGSVANAPARTFLMVDLPTGLVSSESDVSDDQNHLGYVYKPTTDKTGDVLFRKLDPGERVLQTRPLSWVAMKNKYFVVALLAPEARPFDELQVTGGARTEKTATIAHGRVITALDADGSFDFTVYAGPQEWRRMLAVGRDFQDVNPYGGWFRAVVQPFAQIVMRMLLGLKDATMLNYGWVLVIFGVAVRVIMWPLNQKAMRSQLRMQRLQPELQAVQKRFKDDPQKQQQEVMRVYKEHGMSPFSSLGGCLPMMIPMPILFALFWVFQNTIEFRGVPFLWLTDISTYDPYYIMPILTGITSFVMSWIGLRGSPPNPQAKMFAYVMPLTFAVLFARLAAGLHIYYAVQNVAAIPQQWMLARERAKAQPAQPATPTTPPTPASAPARRKKG